MYIIPSLDDPTVWNGVIFVREGPYEGAVLRFKVEFGYSYPASRPIVRFETEVYHREYFPEPSGFWIMLALLALAWRGGTMVFAGSSDSGRGLSRDDNELSVGTKSWHQGTSQSLEEGST